MTAPEIIAYAAVLFLGIPSMLRNWTAVALVGSFLVAHLFWVVTGTCSLATEIMCDYAVIVAVLLKVDTRDCSPLGGLWGQMKPCWSELSRYDKSILALFAPAWGAYMIDSDQVRYWILWGVGLLQFAVAGAEAFTLRHSREGKKARDPAEPLLRWRFAENEC